MGVISLNAAVRNAVLECSKCLPLRPEVNVVFLATISRYCCRYIR